jgi:hypothetical protein
VRYLGLFIYAEGRDNTLWLIDGDAFELENKARGRMTFVQTGSKAHVREAELADLFGDRINLRSVPLYVTRDNIEDLIPPDESAIIFLCVDNHATRRLLDEYCRRRTADLTLLISGGNSAVEEDGGHTGNAQVYLREGTTNRTNPLTTYHPEIADADEDEAPNNDDPDCVQLALKAGSTQIGLTNLAVASTMLNALYAWFRGELDYEEVYLDILQNRVVPRRRALVAPVSEVF